MKKSDPGASPQPTREPERASEPESLKFEDRLAKLESLLDQLERGELPLEEALRAYETGVAELRRCYELLESAESRVRLLVERADGSLTTEDLDK
ncbi:MAG: exodeoxyribonuclease VII small subunit [Planctomycetota bacterium]